jgi:hypothetical protein
MTGRALCILIPTCDRNTRVARFTSGLLNRFWPSHPPVHFCGAAEPAGEEWLPPRSDPRDWVGIVLDACRHLSERGFHSCYLILDDHPPVGTCHEEHLNATLPSFLGKLGGSFIGLNGWGQGRKLQGETLGPAFFDLEKVPPGFAWRYSLHPGLWRLGALERILEFLARSTDLEARSAWSFERRAGTSPEVARVEKEEGGAYRVCGEKMKSKDFSLRRPLLLAAMRRGSGVVDRALSLTGGERRRDDFERKARFLYRFYLGPYPLYWAGLLTKGTPHSGMSLFLRLFVEGKIAEEFTAAVSGHDHVS